MRAERPGCPKRDEGGCENTGVSNPKYEDRAKRISRQCTEDVREEDEDGSWHSGLSK